jgi:hypothetical protein
MDPHQVTRAHASALKRVSSHSQFVVFAFRLSGRGVF